MPPAPTRTILLIGDVHDERERLDATLALVADRAPDLVLLTGDVGCDPPWHRAQRRTERERHDESVRAVLDHVRSAVRSPVAFVPGNHDLHDPPPDVAGINVDGTRRALAGLVVAGFGGAGPTRFGFPYEWTEDEAERALTRLADGPGEIDVLLSHTPPHETTLDRTARGEPVGSRAVRSALVRLRPKLLVCGHIHEAHGVEVVESVPCVNAGALGEPYGRELVWIVRWEDGPVEILCRTLDDGGAVVERRWSDLQRPE